MSKIGVPNTKFGRLYTEHIDFILGKNVPGLLGQYAPDCLLISSFTPDKKPLYVRGHKELEQFFRERIFTLENLDTKIAFWAEDEEKQILMMVEEIHAVMKDGSKMDCRFYDNWSLKDGKISVHFAGTVQYPDGTIA